jgi:dTDP-4-dehydrorhamnose reductase
MRGGARGRAGGPRAARFGYLVDMRPVLVIGSTGFLGVALARTLRDARQSAVLAARRPHESPAAAGLERATKLVLDLRDATALERVLLLLRPRAVVLAAALARVDLCERDPVEAREVNELAPARAAALCARHGVRLVHVSTDLVFGGHAPAPGGFRPEDPPAPCSAYGGTKAAGERAVLAAHPGALVARLPLLCGESFGRGLGAGDSLLAALSRGERPRLFHDEWRTPLDVADAARALVELVDEDVAGVLHVAGPERLSRVELAERVLAAHGIDADRIDRSTRAEAGMPERPRDCSLDARRAVEILPWLAAARVR